MSYRASRSIGTLEGGVLEGVLNFIKAESDYRAQHHVDANLRYKTVLD